MKNANEVKGMASRRNVVDLEVLYALEELFDGNMDSTHSDRLAFSSSLDRDITTIMNAAEQAQCFPEVAEALDAVKDRLFEAAKAVGRYRSSIENACRTIHDAVAETEQGILEQSKERAAKLEYANIIAGNLVSHEMTAEQVDAINAGLELVKRNHDLYEELTALFQDVEDCVIDAKSLKNEIDVLVHESKSTSWEFNWDDDGDWLTAEFTLGEVFVGFAFESGNSDSCDVYTVLCGDDYDECWSTLEADFGEAEIDGMVLVG